MHGGDLGRRQGCTRDKHVACHCDACPYVFPSITARGLQPKAMMSETTLRRRLKSAFQRLEDAGHMELGAAAKMSFSSCRRGGNSCSAAEGVRQAVREKHGRWGLGSARASATAEFEYDAALPGERTGAAGLMCWAPLGRNWALCSLRSRCTKSLSWADETSGSQACVWRVVASPPRHRRDAFLTSRRVRAVASRYLGTAAMFSAQTRTRRPSDTLERVERESPRPHAESPQIEAQLEV